MSTLMSATTFSQLYIYLVVVIVLAIIGRFFGEKILHGVIKLAELGLKVRPWMFHAIILVVGALLTAYAGAVLAVNVPHGIPVGSLPLIFSFAGGAAFTLVWAFALYERHGKQATV